MSELLPNLLLFGRVLRGLGLDAGPGRMIDLVRALRHLDLGSKADVRHAARSLLVHHRDDLPLFDAAFDAFWRKPAEGQTTLDLRALGERRRFRPPRPAPAPLRAASGSDSGAPALSLPQRAWSPAEVLRYKDFGELTADERTDMQRFLEAFAWPLPPRRVRRRRPGRGPDLDLRRTLRMSLRRGGEVLGFARRRRRSRPRPIVVLADVSGSMEPYARLLLVFARALAADRAARVEAFVFGTRLTRVTRALRTGDVEAALRAVAREAPDWGGGTRMGEALRAFNLGWSRRVRAGGAVVLLISDGWDRGDPGLLGEEMARLQRSCHRLVWLNPLLGAPDYEPVVRGMQAALPYVDDFLPIHHLASLQDLARRLRDLPPHRRHA